MKRKSPPPPPSKVDDVKAVEYSIPFLAPCEHCGRCQGESETNPVLDPKWEWAIPPNAESTRQLRESNPKPVPYVDSRDSRARARYRDAVISGEPIILSGSHMNSLLDFSKPWFANAGREFDVKTFIRSVGDAEAPIARNGYTGSQLASGEHMQVKSYIQQFWPLANAAENYPYLAQWEFSSAILDLEEEEDEVELSGLRLPHWKDSKVPKEVIGTDFLSVNGKMNPFQYLFIGGPGTNSKLHNDKGGMTILISCLVGEKRFTLIHRDDELLLKQMDVRRDGAMNSRDINLNPQAFLARTWQCVIQPGDVLVIPPRTIHAVENLTAVISYSRFHVTCEDLGEWLRSFVAFDSPSLPHTETVHQAAQYFIQLKEDDMDEEAMQCIKHLRDACRVLASRVEKHDEATFWIWISCASELDSKLPESEQRPVITSTTTTAATQSDSIVAGDVISLLPGVVGGKRKNRRAVVVNVERSAYLARVKFPDFGLTELVPIKLVRPLPEKQVIPDLAPNVRVEVRWSTGETFQGVFQSTLPLTPVQAMEIQFHQLGSEWNQWITTNEVAHVTRGFRVEL